MTLIQLGSYGGEGLIVRIVHQTDKEHHRSGHVQDHCQLAQFNGETPGEQVDVDGCEHAAGIRAELLT